jgi:phosphoribosylformimino-5-aminoimidazole carboxamide ribotide isomerase
MLDGLQIAGGINARNAMSWIERGASKVIVTSCLFPDAKFSLERLVELEKLVGKDRLVVDVRYVPKHIVLIRQFSKTRRQVVRGHEPMEDNHRYGSQPRYLNSPSVLIIESLSLLEQYCSELLVHAADVEGLCKGIDEDLVRKLGEWVTIPTTYAGGGKSLDDLSLVNRLSNGKVDLTIGSALDLFGGTGVKFTDCIAWNNEDE